MCRRANLLTLMMLLAAVTPLRGQDQVVQLRLDDFEAAAMASHPAIEEIREQVIAAQYRAEQAGWMTNPSLGVFGEELGNDDNALWGFYLARTFRRGGERCRDREVGWQRASVLQQQLAQRQLRVLTDVRTAFYTVLIAQRRLELTEQLNETQQNAASQVQLLFESAETPKTDLLQSQINAGQSLLAVRQAELALTGAWRELLAVAALPETPWSPVQGSLDNLPPTIDWETALDQLLHDSPEIHEAQASIELAQAVYRQELANAVPDVQAQLSLGQDTATDDIFGGFQVQMPIQVNDGNEGNIAAALAGIRRAHQQRHRIELSLKQRLANEFRDYRVAMEQTNAFTNDLLPKAEQALELATAGYREGETSFLQLLAVQKTGIDLTVQYLQSLQQLWISHQRIAGLLLSNGLQSQ